MILANDIVDETRQEVFSDEGKHATIFGN